MDNQVRENRTSQISGDPLYGRFNCAEHGREHCTQCVKDSADDGPEVSLANFFRWFPEGALSIDPHSTPLAFYDKIRERLFLEGNHR